MKKVAELRDKVRKAYSEAAEKPAGEHAFPVGRRFAESLGYPQDLLAGLPAAAVEAFSGVSNVAISADIPEGAAVARRRRPTRRTCPSRPAPSTWPWSTASST